jgi:hypothetical protein
MRKVSNLVALAVLVAGLGAAAPAAAAALKWAGTLQLTLGSLPPILNLGTGAANVNGSGGAGHLNTLRLVGGLTGSVATIPLTGPENPTLVTLRVTGLGLGSGTLDGISGGPPLGPQNTLPVVGDAKMCILFSGCANYLPIPFPSFPHSQIGMGVGGFWDYFPLDKGNAFKYSLWYAPWTIGIASIRNVTTETANGAITTYTVTIQGSAHGPASGTSNTAVTSGVIGLVTPTRVQTNLGSPHRFEAVSAQLTLRFIPEPGRVLLLGSGIAGLVLLGRSRLRGR